MYWQGRGNTSTQIRSNCTNVRINKTCTEKRKHKGNTPAISQVT